MHWGAGSLTHVPLQEMLTGARSAGAAAVHVQEARSSALCNVSP